MITSWRFALVVGLGLVVAVGAAAQEFKRTLPPAGNVIPAADRVALEAGVVKLAGEIEKLRGELKDKPELLGLLPDVVIFHKAVDWPLRYAEVIDVKKARAALERGMERVAELRAGRAPWVEAGGVRAYVSRVDGSVQPYLVNVPKGYAGAGVRKQAPYRLDIFYHGRGENLTELNFISGRVGEAGAAPVEHFTVYPYGRFCCANKFAGEVDTLEILEAMKRQYPIDENRVVMMGFSMGGAAAWHMAVHYSDLWCAASPGAGFAETREYQHMDKGGEWAALPEYRKRLFHLYDCPDWCWNLQMVPTIAYAGTDDPQKQSGDIMEKAMAGEGLKLERVWGPKTGHKYEAGAKKDLDARLSAYAAKGREVTPKEVHFETWTLRYNRMFWVTVDGLERHWERGRVDAVFDGSRVTLKTAGVTGLTIDLPVNEGKLSVTIDGTVVEVGADGGRARASLVRAEGAWKLGGGSVVSAGSRQLLKRHGLQGPIDDAFMDSFMIVKPSRVALSPKLEAWTKAEVYHASHEWRNIFRGEAREKNDHEVTDADIAAHNLVLFGDPSSNALIARIADRLPIKWTKDGIVVAGKVYAADHHALTMIYPNPLNRSKYVVLNSGFTFREGDHKTNSRQVAKLPDWAVIDLDVPADDKGPGGIIEAGFFDESWKIGAGR